MQLIELLVQVLYEQRGSDVHSFVVVISRWNECCLNSFNKENIHRRRDGSDPSILMTPLSIMVAVERVVIQNLDLRLFRAGDVTSKYSAAKNIERHKSDVLVLYPDGNPTDIYSYL
jgi:hypothetical protein